MKKIIAFLATSTLFFNVHAGDAPKPDDVSDLERVLIIKPSTDYITQWGGRTLPELIRKDRERLQQSLSKHVGISWTYMPERSSRYLVVQLPSYLGRDCLKKAAEHIASFKAVDFAELDPVITTHIPTRND